MTMQGNVLFRGASGLRYRFEVWPLGTKFRAAGAVCVFTQRGFSNRTFTQMASHKCLCIGQTSNLAHLRYDLPQFEGADCVCVYVASEEQVRLRVQQDLLDGLGIWRDTPVVKLSADDSVVPHLHLAP